MPDFTYDGDAGRVYPDLPPPANVPTPGETYELDHDPGDGRWTSKKSRAKSEEQ
jgi:hypothetical protein